ncbi:MAG: RagB/SusD family nutrient uptake outer membrane protein [Flavobacteriaceae bacterium]
MKKIILYTTICLLFACSSDDLEPTLEQIKDVETSINSVQDLDGILKGALSRLTQSNYYGRDFIITDEIRGDNVFANGNSGRFQTQGAMTYIPSNNIGIWTRAYSVIASSNIIINVNIEELSGDRETGENIQGQALFLRALAHFDLLRQYGTQYAGSGSQGVPIVTEFKGDNLFPSRNSVNEVKEAIYSDLDAAFNLMTDEISSDKQYPSKYAAKALESRLALYFEDWSRAANAAATVIDADEYTIATATDYVNSFSVDNSSNSIFELAFDNVDNQGINGLGYIYRGVSYGDIEVHPEVLEIYEPDDIRLDIFGYEGDLLRNMGKYPTLLGYDNVIVLRIEEVILNYAEALFEQGQESEALTQINKITAARNASAHSSLTSDAILVERRKELIFEGFRFFDLSRAGLPITRFSLNQNIEATIPAGDYRYALPIPLTEMDANSNMDQNPGY